MSDNVFVYYDFNSGKDHTDNAICKYCKNLLLLETDYELVYYYCIVCLLSLEIGSCINVQ